MSADYPVTHCNIPEDLYLQQHLRTSDITLICL